MLAVFRAEPAEAQNGQRAATEQSAATPPQAIAPAPAAIGIRVGDHEGFGRVVFDLTPQIEARVTQEGDRTTVSLDRDAAFGLPARMPRNVVGLHSTGRAAILTTSPGTRLRQTRLDNRLIVDLLDPAEPARATSPRNAPPQIKTGASNPPPAPASAAALPTAPSPAPARAAIPSVGPAGQTGTPSTTSPHAPPVATLQSLAATGQLPPIGLSVAPPPLAPPSSPPAEAPGSDAVAVGNAAAHHEAQRAADQPFPHPSPDGNATARTGATSGGERAGASDPLPTDTAEAPLTLAARLVTQSDGSRAVVLPFARETGAAAFRRDDEAFVVFDERKPLDLAALRNDPQFAPASIQLLPQATLLRLKLSPTDSLAFSRTRSGWTLRRDAADGPARATDAIRAEPVDGRVLLAAKAPGRVVAVPDPSTGTVLLVGTQRESGQAVTIPRRRPEFSMPRTWQGVMVEPANDAIALRSVVEGFVVSADARKLPLAGIDADAAAELDAAAFTRRFALPAGSPASLDRLLRAQIGSAAAAPARSRLRARLDAARTMLSLGLGPEAQAVLAVAAADAPDAADDPELRGLTAIAGLIARRPEGTEAIDDPRLDGPDDVALWRAVRAASRDPASPQAAAAFAAELPLLRALPTPLRTRLLPEALQAMAAGGQADIVRRVLDKQQDEPGLELARALALEHASKPDPAAALAAYDQLEQSSDRLVRYQAAIRGVELRLASGALTPAQAADALEKRLFAWRGDDRELALRLRVAELRRQSGAFRPALALLRETESGWPEQRDRLHELLGKTFADALARDAVTPLPPLDLVALVDENPDLLPAGERGRGLARHVAERLTALDLPDRALTLLDKLAVGTMPGAARAELGAHAAALRLDQGDAPRTLATLRDSDAPELPPRLAETRALLQARASAAGGDLAGATATLASIGTPAATRLRATLLEQAKDWPAAVRAWKDYAALSVPTEGKLGDAPAQTVLRLAAAATQAGDEATLAQLRAQVLPRLPAGRLADMATLLSGQPMARIEDLRMLDREAKLVQQLPDSLAALGTSSARSPAAGSAPAAASAPSQTAPARTPDATAPPP